MPRKKKEIEIPPELLSPEAEAQGLAPLPAPDGEAISDACAGLTDDEAQIYRLLSGRGQAGAKQKNPPLVCHVLGPLSTGDLQGLDELRIDGRAKTTTAKLTRVRSIHHQIAQYLAQGYSAPQISVLLGVGANRINQLNLDPAFKELRGIYENKQQEVAVSIMERLQTVALLGLEEVQERLLDNPDLFSNPQVMKLIELALDRSGHGPGGQSQKADGSLSSEEVAQLKAEVRGAEKSKVVSRQASVPLEGEYLSNTGEESKSGGDTED